MHYECFCSRPYLMHYGTVQVSGILLGPAGFPKPEFNVGRSLVCNGHSASTSALCVQYIHENAQVTPNAARWAKRGTHRQPRRPMPLTNANGNEAGVSRSGYRCDSLSTLSSPSGPRGEQEWVGRFSSLAGNPWRSSGKR